MNVVHRIFCGAAWHPTVGITDPPPWELETLPRELEVPHRGNYRKVKIIVDPTEGIT